MPPAIINTQLLWGCHCTSRTVHLRRKQPTFATELFNQGCWEQIKIRLISFRI